MRLTIILLTASLFCNLFLHSQALDTIYFRGNPQQPILATKIHFDNELFYYQIKENIGTEIMVKKSSVLKVCYWDNSTKSFDSEVESIVIDTLTAWDRKMIYKAGIHLKKHTEFTYIGMGTTLAGGILAGVGFGIQNNTLGYIGLGVGGVGVILSLIPPIHVAKAGNFLIKFGLNTHH